MKEQLQHLRKLKGLTQNDIAEIIDVKLTTYQKYERDAIFPSYDTLVKIADFYGVTTDYLLGREELTSIDKIGGEFNMTALEKIILEEYIKLPAEIRGDLMQFLRDSVQRVMDDEKPKIETRKVITAARSPTSQGATVEEYPVSTLEALKNAPDRSDEIDDL